MDISVFLALALGGGAGAIIAWMTLSGRRRRAKDDAFEILGTNASAALARGAAPPVDLSQPITTDAHWRAIRAHARDPAYRAAVDMVRGRYRFANPMLLSNTLRTTMDRGGMNFREAMIEVGKDDGLR